MTIGFYPGSFNPWHQGHDDVFCKALKVFDKVVVLQLSNPDKEVPKILTISDLPPEALPHNVEIYNVKNTFLTTIIGDYILFQKDADKKYAVIRGLRNGNDLEYERVQQYWNEDLGLKIPTVYFVSDRSLVHISSSAIRVVNKFMELENERYSSGPK